MAGADIGIDLGTANVLVYVDGKGIVLEEPSVVAIEKNTNKVLAVGNEARKMIGRTPANIVAIRPLKDGVISDYEVTEKMLKYFTERIVEKKGFGRLVMPRIMVCVPTGVTEVEKRAVRRSNKRSRSKRSLYNRRTYSSSNWSWYGYIFTKWKYGNRYRWRNYRYSSYISWWSSS